MTTSFSHSTLLFSILFSTFSLFAQVQVEDKTDEFLHGPVRKIIQEERKAFMKGDKIKIRERTDYLLVDVNMEKTYFQDGTLAQHVVNSLDGLPYLKTDFIYDSLSHALLEEVFYEFKTAITYRHLYSYNDLGKCIRKKYLEDKTKITTSTVFTYNSSNKIDTTKEFNEKNQLASYQVKSYDEFGNVIKNRSFQPNGNFLFKNTTSYNQAGKQLKYVVLSERNELLQTTINSYENDTTLVKTEVLGPTNQINYISEYNEEGMLIKFQNFDLDGNLTTTERYEYTELDDFGNWTKCLIWENDQIAYVRKRRIFYHKELLAPPLETK